jgi:hypothetical protein
MNIAAPVIIKNTPVRINRSGINDLKSIAVKITYPENEIKKIKTENERIYFENDFT